MRDVKRMNYNTNKKVRGSQITQQNGGRWTKWRSSLDGGEHQSVANEGCDQQWNIQNTVYDDNGFGTRIAVVIPQ